MSINRNKNFHWEVFWKSGALKQNDTQNDSQNPWKVPKKYLAHIYLFELNNRITRKRCEVCSKLTTKTPEWSQWHHSGVFIVNFEHI